MGNVLEINVWDDKWVPSLPMIKLMGLDRYENVDLRGSNFVDPICGSWKRDELEKVFTNQEVNAILEIALIRVGKADRRVWNFTKHRVYPVSS